MPADVVAVIDLFAHPGFLTGLSAALLTAAIFSGLALALGRRLRGWAFALTATVVVVLAIRQEIDPLVIGWLSVLAGAGLLVDLAHALGRGRWGVGVKAGAWVGVVAASIWFGVVLGTSDPAWVTYAVPLAVLALASGLWLSARQSISELAGPMLALVVAGLWVTVPETDVVTVLVGAMIPFGLVTLPPMRARASMTGGMAFAGLFVWMSIGGGAVRPWTLAATWAAGAGLLLVAGAAWMRERRPRQLLVLVVHLLFVLAITRVADYTDSEVVVAVWLLLLFAVAGLAVVLGPGPREG